MKKLESIKENKVLNLIGNILYTILNGTNLKIGKTLLNFIMLAFLFILKKLSLQSAT